MVGKNHKYERKWVYIYMVKAWSQPIAKVNRFTSSSRLLESMKLSEIASIQLIQELLKVTSRV